MQTNREELHQLISLAREERNRRDRVEEIVGNVIFSILGACVLFTIFLWLTR